jgi:hypothetical protein
VGVCDLISVRKCQLLLSPRLCQLLKAFVLSCKEKEKEEKELVGEQRHQLVCMSRSHSHLTTSFCCNE